MTASAQLAVDVMHTMLSHNANLQHQYVGSALCTAAVV
jgi:hypothetical protein